MHKVMLAVGCGMGIAADVNVPIGGTLEPARHDTIRHDTTHCASTN